LTTTEPRPRELKATRAALQKSIARHLTHTLGRAWPPKQKDHLFLSLAYALRDRLAERMLETEARYQASDLKRVHYVSMEFLLGRSLVNNLYNLGLFETCRKVLAELGADIEEVQAEEGDAPLGNGGLGRLAACFLDSMATLGIAGYGHGIHYEYGLFRQEIDNGYQKEQPDSWTFRLNPWEIARPDEACIVPVFGRVEHGVDRSGAHNPMWLDWQIIVGVPYDMPVAGYGGHTVNYLRLYAAHASSEFDIRIFNEGDYFRAVEQKISAETISKVLYPSDVMEAGKQLRLVQEYFLVACSLNSVVRQYLQHHEGFDAFPDKVALQMNDTHPSLAVAELMRLLVDEHALPWDEAWDITRRTLAYTNHTLLSEALEKWPVELIRQVLPRHLEIIYEINRRLLDQVSMSWPGDVDRLRRMSLIEEGPERKIRMAHLAIVGSHSTNGVSALHTELVKQSLVPDFYEMWPERFNNKTNGVTQRRWLLEANPQLAQLISATIGPEWVTDLSRLRDLEPFAGREELQNRFREIKRANKELLGAIVFDTARVKVQPDSLFDVHAKRMHEYKRQLLKTMHVIHEYLRIVEDDHRPAVPRTYLFAGKAAPGYWQAKQIIKLINNVAQVVNRDPRVGDAMKVAFVPDYRVSLAERLIPAADLSEQISTAGTEASGTGNMKFALNGALTVGTLDGANVEMLEEVGEKNFYLFGLRTEQVQQMRSEGYRPWEHYGRHPEIRRVLDSLRDDRFCPDEPGLFTWIFRRLLEEGDPYFHLADFPSYLDAQRRAEQDYLDPRLWAQKAILNVARMGKFSSDRTIAEYAREIWGCMPGVEDGRDSENADRG
jgi:glycogen phosphorylase